MALTGREVVYNWNGTTPITVEDLATYSNVALDIQNQSASVAVPTTPTIIVAPVVAVKQNILYDTTTGIVTFIYTRPYDFVLMFNLNSVANNNIYGYAEVNTGSGFVPLRYSARAKAFSAQNGGQQNFQSTNIFPAGAKVRFGVYAFGAATFVSQDLPGTTPGTLTVPGVRILITG